MTNTVLTLVPEALRLVSDALDDIEGLRKATGNRIRSATSTWVDEKTGVVRGLGLDERQPLVAAIKTLNATLQEQEHKIVLQLQREIRKTVFGSWLKLQKGVGEKTLVRLLAAIGDPYLRSVPTEDTNGQLRIDDVPRTVRQLWAYSGYATDDGAARRIKKGASQTEVFAAGKPAAKMRAYLIAEGLIKSGVRTIDKTLEKEEGTGYPFENREAISHYGELYLARRRATINKVHGVPCVRCGPSGRPAQPESPWSGAHQQADALRVLAKEVLKDLWLVAREAHTGIPIDAPAEPALVLDLAA